MVQASPSASRPKEPVSALVKRRDEFLGILVMVSGLLLLAALLTYDPNDPSLFSAVGDPSARPGNWAGRVGASFADGAIQFFGFASGLIPLVLLASGFRRFVGRPITAWATKGLGIALLMLTLAPLADLAFGRPHFLGGGLSGGGFVGDRIAAALVSALNLPGATLVLLATLLIAGLLATSLSLGDATKLFLTKLSAWWQVRSLERARKAEVALKEELRRDVVKKHLERAREDAERREREPQETEDAGPEAEVFYIPSVSALRVKEKTGRGGFSIQKTRATSPAPVVPMSVSPRLAAQAAQAAALPSKAPETRPLDVSSIPLSEPAAHSKTASTLAEIDLSPAAEAGVAPIPASAPMPSAPHREEPRPIQVARPALLTRKEDPEQKVLPFPLPRDAGGWVFPPVRLLRPAPKRDREKDKEEFRATMELITSKCLEFGVEGIVDAYTPGPVVTVYEFKPSAGVKVARIASLENDLALALAAEKVRIERIPGRAAVGIEVPNKNRDLIALRDVIETEKFQKTPSLLTLCLGIDVHGEPIVADLARMPHLLVAGQTGAGKSVGVGGMITSILYKARPDEVKFIFVDPKMNDMKDYEDIPHLLVPVITEPKKAANALKWAVDEMEGRYKLLSGWPGVRNIEQYNAAIKDPDAVAEVKEKLGSAFEKVVKAVGGGEGEDAVIPPMPYIVIVIDELADLMMTAPREIEESVARLAQKARAIGIHLILATQRPSVDVITGTIKANLPCRIAFTTRTKIDSRTILDSMGAEALLGQGDMLFLAPGTSTLMRVHAGYIGGDETKEICKFLKKQGKPIYDTSVIADREAEAAAAAAASNKSSSDDQDPMFDTAARLVVRERMASISFLQRRLEIGFSRAGKLMDMLERDGIVGPAVGGSKSRDVLVDPGYFQEVDARL